MSRDCRIVSSRISPSWRGGGHWPVRLGSRWWRCSRSAPCASGSGPRRSSPSGTRRRAADMLALALTRDMRGAQESVLSSPDWSRADAGRRVRSQRRRRERIRAIPLPRGVLLLDRPWHREVGPVLRARRSGAALVRRAVHGRIASRCWSRPRPTRHRRRAGARGSAGHRTNAAGSRFSMCRSAATDIRSSRGCSTATASAKSRSSCSASWSI